MKVICHEVSGVQTTLSPNEYCIDKNKRNKQNHFCAPQKKKKVIQVWKDKRVMMLLLKQKLLKYFY